MDDFLFQNSEALSIAMFFIPPILSILILYFTKRNWVWLSIPITIVVDLLVWGRVVLELSHGRVALIFLIPQILVVAVISYAILFNEKRKKIAK